MPAFLLLFLVVFTPAHAQLATPDTTGISYGHLHMNVTDVEQHTQLWEQYFNGKRVSKGSLQAIQFPNVLILLTPQTPTGGTQESVLHHLGFKVRNIEMFLEHWRLSGLPAGNVFTGAEGQRNVYVTLPDGIYVELQEDQALATEISGYHIHYFTPQYQQLLDWYTDMFSLETRPRGSIASTTNVPGMNLSFGDADGDRLPTQGRAIDHIGFELVDLESFCKALEAKGIKFDVPYREIPSLGLKVAFLTDPSGVYIELTEGLLDL